MGYRSTAKQRLWLTCLGYDVPATADGNEASDMFQDASSSGRYQEPPTPRQKRVAGRLGINIEDMTTCYDAAGALYQVFLLQAWVFSVWRSISGHNASSHAELEFSVELALIVAREMYAAGMLSLIEQYATTDGREGDVFYRMSKSAKASQVYRYAAERLLQMAAKPVQVRSSSTKKKVGKRKQAEMRHITPVQPGKGCVLLIACGVIALLAWCIFAK